MIDVYVIAVNHQGRYAVAFERNDDTAFLYLLDLTQDEGHQIVEAFDAHAITTMPADIQSAVA